MTSTGDVLEIYLQPGGFYFGGPDVRVKTVLGSCVAMTLWHPQRRIGGIGHFMLPDRSRSRREDEDLDGRYADDVLELFFGRMRESHTNPDEYELKLFGGGNMFPEMAQTKRGDDVPSRNVKAAQRLANENGFELKAEHLGGHGHRSLIFDLRDGSVYLRHKGVTPAGDKGA